MADAVEVVAERRGIAGAVTGVAEAVSSGSKRMDNWLKILGGGGIALFLTWLLVGDLRRNSDADRQFFQGKFLTAIQENTTAMQTQTLATQSQTAKSTEVLVKLDQLCDSHRDLCKEQARQSDSIDRLMQKVWGEKPIKAPTP